RGSDVEYRLLVAAAAAHDRLQALDLAVDVDAELAQPEHAQRVADLLQKIELRHEVGGFLHARADVDVQHVLDPAEVLLDRARDRPHELDAGGREALARVLHLLVARQQLRQVEGRAYLPDALAGRARARDVVEEIVQQVGDGMLVESLGPFVDQELDAAVGLPEQPLERDRGLEPAVAQRLEHGTRDPPELVHVVAGRALLERLHHRRERLQVLLLVPALDPPEQRELELRAELRGYPDGILAARLALAFAGLPRRRQVEQQQRAFGQERLAARGAQVVQHRQQHERDVAPAAEQALDVCR